MRVLLFGATGMVGQGALRECLVDPRVTDIQTIGRTPTGVPHPKLREWVKPDLASYDQQERQRLTGWDACFFCLGVSSAGMSETDYVRITYALTVAAATILADLNPEMTFIYVSGAGTDSTERGRTMWARVKGRTENALLQLSSRAYMFRPGVIEPVAGVRSRTPLYRAFYLVLKPVLPLLRRMLPRYIITTAELGRAMLTVVAKGAPSRVLET